MEHNRELLQSAKRAARHSAVLDSTLTGSAARFACFVAREQGQPLMEHNRELLQSAKRAARHSAVLDCTLTGSPPDSPPSSLANKALRPAMEHTRELLQSAKRAARHSAIQATDSVSRRREEITVETPSPRMLIPYRASAISIVRFWCVMTSSWLVARNSS